MLRKTVFTKFTVESHLSIFCIRLVSIILSSLFQFYWFLFFQSFVSIHSYYLLLAIDIDIEYVIPISVGKIRFKFLGSKITNNFTQDLKRNISWCPYKKANDQLHTSKRVSHLIWKKIFTSAWIALSSIPDLNNLQTRINIILYLTVSTVGNLKIDAIVAFAKLHSFYVAS